MYTVYILNSFTYRKTYTGYTSNLLERFYSHNIYGQKGWTKSFRPWVFIYSEVFEIKEEAVAREKELKSGKGREWVKCNLIDWLKVFG